ncbi:quillaic acid 3-O-glycosyltransferase CSL1-like isoform X2 [Tasmannia lanceolata]|uniref:quillaic acid 3-O-glycosyltransferase CSL1-like isoform X2 n=1 Tax=Tasmannia lanceolata TaxID=3420 RepID=UPI0040637176
MEIRRENEKRVLCLSEMRVEASATMSRIQGLIHSALIMGLLYYRTKWLLFYSPRPMVMLAWSLVLASEILQSFLWFLNVAFSWRPVSRTVFPENLPDDRELPPIDVFICTADPEKEPAVEVMNTVISAMSLDYPADKLSVYLSDDGGSPITLYALKEAASFASSWLPFCRKHGIQTRCPEAYFSATHEDYHRGSPQLLKEREKIKLMYEVFKERANGAAETSKEGDKSFNRGHNRADRPAVIEVIHEKGRMDMLDDGKAKMPMLVYVSREKRPQHPHHFKAGALNVLAMCFHLDPQISPSMAFVLFPQAFYNISNNDIYCNQLRSVFKSMWKGCDGLKGPILTGTNFYMKREALYGNSPGYSVREGFSSADDRKKFGPSNELIALVHQNYKFNAMNRISSKQSSLREALILASCNYEKDTKWGEQIGFLYDSVVEDYFTGFHLHCRGWTSVYCNPLKPSFLGTSPTNLNDCLVQNKRWGSGLLQVSFSRFCPLTYGVFRTSLLQSMCYGSMSLQPLSSFFVLCYAIVPQLCLLHNISLYPKVSDPWFLVFVAIFVSSLCQHLLDVFSTGGSFKTFWNEQRFWMMKAASAHFLSCLSIIMKLIGTMQIDFELTSKVVDKEQIQRYESGTFDFRGATMLIFPLVSLTILNAVSFTVGVGKIIAGGIHEEMLGQIFLTFFILINSYPIIEGIIIRKDMGRVPSSITFFSVIFSIILLSLGYIILHV